MTKMKTLKVFMALAVVLGMSTPAFAACKPGAVLKRIGSSQTGSASITTFGQDVHMVAIDCGASACLAGLYNVDGLGSTTAANVTVELGGAANASVFHDLTESPLYFSDGIAFVDDGNIDSITLFGCEAGVR